MNPSDQHQLLEILFYNLKYEDFVQLMVKERSFFGSSLLENKPRPNNSSVFFLKSTPIHFKEAAQSILFAMTGEKPHYNTLAELEGFLEKHSIFPFQTHASLSVSYTGKRFYCASDLFFEHSPYQNSSHQAWVKKINDFNLLFKKGYDDVEVHKLKNQAFERLFALDPASIKEAADKDISTFTPTKHRVGIELEGFFTEPLNAEQSVFILQEAFKKMDIPYVVGESNSKFWCIKREATVAHPHPYNQSPGIEVTSPAIQTQEEFKRLAIVCRTLKALGIKVNSTCGLHVHVESHSQKKPVVSALLKNYAFNEKEIEQHLPYHRQKGHFIGNRILPHGEDRIKYIEKMEKIEGLSRSASEVVDALNLKDKFNRISFVTLFSPQNTIEFRQHHGTLNFSKIMNWVNTTDQLVYHSEQSPGKITELVLENEKFKILPPRTLEEINSQFQTSRAPSVNLNPVRTY